MSFAIRYHDAAGLFIFLLKIAISENHLVESHFFFIHIVNVYIPSQIPFFITTIFINSHVISVSIFSFRFFLDENVFISFSPSFSMLFFLLTNNKAEMFPHFFSLHLNCMDMVRYDGLLTIESNIARKIANTN